MASALTIGLGALGAAFAGRLAYQMFKLRGPAEQFVRGGFKGKMDKNEALQILGLRWVVAFSRFSLSLAFHWASICSPDLESECCGARMVRR